MLVLLFEYKDNSDFAFVVGVILVVEYVKSFKDVFENS